jgi:O-succinylbenzoic acid--CoA ligase
MISGGVKVSLAEIERVIQHSTPAHDGVVVAAPSETWGQVPVLVTTVSVDLEQIRAMLATVIGPHARVERFIQVAEIPLLGSGKPDRVSLHTLAQAGLRG